MEGRAIIDFNTNIYNFLVSNTAFNSSSINRRILALRAVSLFCSTFHTGRFNSSFCNNQIKQIASHFNKPKDDVKRIDNSVLFIATSLYVTGGHTRLMENIAAFEKSQGNKITLIITEQVKKQVPARILKSTVFEEVLCLGNHSRLKSVKTLHQYIQLSKKIYNNQDPYDPVPPIALENAARPVTIYINHADHVFWLGAQQTDTILHIRPYGEQLSKERRSSIANNIILPIRINTHLPAISKQAARQQLNLPQKVKVLLTISSHYKLVPKDEYNLFEVIDTLLIKEPNLVYILVGINNIQYKELSGKEPPAQVLALGEVEDPTIYKLAADFYLEGMPVVSLTALLDGVFAGAYPFLIWKPYYTCAVSDGDFCINGLVKHPSNKSEYLHQVTQALNYIDTENYSSVVNQIQKRIIYYSSNEYWAGILNNLRPKPLNEEDFFTEFSYAADDITLAELLYNSRTDKNPIEYYILNVMYSSLSYTMFIKLTFFLFGQSRQTGVLKTSAKQMAKKAIRSFFPIIANRYSRRIY